MNMQYDLIQELMLYEFELGDNTTESTKNIWCAKYEGTVDPNAQMVQEILLARTSRIWHGY